MAADLKFIQDMVKCLAGVGIYHVGSSDSQLRELLRESLGETVSSLTGEQAALRIFRSMRPDCIYEVKGILNIFFLAIYRSDEQRFLMIGPCLMDPLTETEAKLQLHQSGLEQEMVRRVVEFVRRLPVVPYETMHQLGALLAGHLYGIPAPVPYRHLEYRWDFKAHREIMLVEHYEDMEQMRQVELRYEASAVLTEAVKQGNLSLAYQAMGQMQTDQGQIVRNPNPLRNAQNLCIILNTQLRHAMEETGIHPYRLDQFSHGIALQIEQLRSAADAGKYSMEIIRRYCELAREHAHPELKPFTHLAVTYIKEHLSDNLTVKDTAKALLVNANYLSHQFHQDMGITFIEFVNRERIKQAATLLKHTNLQIQQIAASVGYNNTSYFARQFMKYQKMTPRNFRSAGVL